MTPQTNGREVTTDHQARVLGHLSCVSIVRYNIGVSVIITKHSSAITAIEMTKASMRRLGFHELV